VSNGEVSVCANVNAQGALSYPSRGFDVSPPSRFDATTLDPKSGRNKSPVDGWAQEVEKAKPQPPKLPPPEGPTWNGLMIRSNKDEEIDLHGDVPLLTRFSVRRGGFAKDVKIDPFRHVWNFAYVNLLFFLALVPWSFYVPVLVLSHIPFGIAYWAGRNHRGWRVFHLDLLCYMPCTILPGMAFAIGCFVSCMDIYWVYRLIVDIFDPKIIFPAHEHDGKCVVYGREEHKYRTEHNLLTDHSEVVEYRFAPIVVPLGVLYNPDRLDGTIRTSPNFWNVHRNRIWQLGENTYQRADDAVVSGSLFYQILAERGGRRRRDPEVLAHAYSLYADNQSAIQIPTSIGGARQSPSDWVVELLLAAQDSICTDF
jgi:hypothetical protein